MTCEPRTERCAENGETTQSVNRSRHTIVFDTVSAVDIPRILLENVRRNQVLYLRIQQKSWLVREAEKFGLIRKISVTHLPHLRYRSDGDRWLGVELTRSTLLEEVSSVLADAIRLSSGTTLPTDFCAALVSKWLLETFYEWAILDTWLKATVNETVIVRSSDPIARIALADSPEGVRLVWSRRPFAIKVVGVLSFPLRLVSVGRFAVKRPTGRDPESSAGPEERGGLLAVFNRSLTYGSLYSYDYFYESDPLSPLHNSRVRHLFLNAAPGDRIPTGSVVLSSLFGSRVVRGIRSLALYSQLSHKTTKTVDRHVLFAVCRLASGAIDLHMGLKAKFPDCNTALLVFEFQIPVALSLAMRLASIISIAAVERPNMCFHESCPIIADVLLVGNVDQGMNAQDMTTSYIGAYRVVGLWRTDFLHQELNGQKRGSGTFPDQKKLVLVLPFVILDGRYEVHDVAVTDEGFVHFMKEVSVVAKEFPDVNFVIRGKNLEWLRKSAAARVIPLLSESGNVRIDGDYAEHGVTYRLAARADVVLAKYTSLVDECLFAGIPTIVHDYTENASGRFIATNSYLPEEIFCLDRSDLLRKLHLVLEDPLSGALTEGEAAELFDGRVQDRIRIELRRELEENQGISRRRGVEEPITLGIASLGQDSSDHWWES